MTQTIDEQVDKTEVVEMSNVECAQMQRDNEEGERIPINYST